MTKQILIGIKEQKLSEIAHYLMIYFPYNEEMCSYTDAWMGELYENKYPLVTIRYVVGNNQFENTSAAELEVWRFVAVNISSQTFNFLV